MKIIYSLFLVIIGSLNAFTTFGAAATRSDSLDIRKTILHFDMTAASTQNISAHCQLVIKARVNAIQMITLDLQGLTVDSVQVNSMAASFSHVSPDLAISLASPLSQNDSVQLDIFYHGTPPTDAIWGGFYFLGNYAFQMGAGFDAQPHSFGRAWHPCFDNFVERSPYEFFITTALDRMAVCNGLLVDSSNNGVTKLWHWKLNEEIPSYLASLTMANYVILQKSLSGLQGITPAWITCEAADSNHCNTSFSHLQESFSALETNFGPYQWPRVGYSLVPFNGGAMEHATNIHVGKGFVDGTLTYETLFAHELAHHWWGDLVTCRTAGDMWLNEGMASYSEALHQEYVYGKNSYTTYTKATHYNVLANAHINDDGYRAVSNMDSMYTYGTTVYLKGADVAHTLRAYLGDSLFFNGMKSFLTNHHFLDISTIELRDYLNTYTGKNLNSFFTNWVMAPGFPDFTIDSIQSTPNGSQYDVKVFLRQRKHHSIDYYSNVPLELAFYNAQMEPHIFQIEMNGQCLEFDVTLPFNPEMTIIDPDYKISDAVTDETKVIKATGVTSFTQAKCRVLVKSTQNLTDSAFIRVAHHWVAPDRFKQATNFPGYVLNDKHYWHVDGIHLAEIGGLLHFNYNASATNSYLDSSWVKNTEDSIRLFYRPDATQEWQFANDSLVSGSLTDKNGSMYAKSILSGDYALGIKRSNFIDPLQTDAATGPCNVVTKVLEPILYSSFSIFPNPAVSYCQIVLKDGNDAPMRIQLFDIEGKCVLDETKHLNHGTCSIEVESLHPGLYVLSLTDKNHNSQRFKLLKQ
ncbi:MAG TPA: M1 family aminopeptidase [Chitinophagaceae bacterium]|nr:M1 family aminopeptidase [Chitinophagaceae bacterium]